MASIIHSIGKYRRLGIAVLIGLSMITFVLCAGNKADLSEALIKYFNPHHGEAVATVNGVNLYRQDIDELKTQRQVANHYIKSLVSQLIEYVNERRKTMPEKLEEEPQKRFNQVLHLQQVLVRRHSAPNFFDTGTKIEELVDFKTWLAEADRLDIRITHEELQKLIALDTNRYQILNSFQGAAEVDRQMQRQAEQKVRDISHNASLAMLRRGLMDEYRVRIAKLAAIELQVSTYVRESDKRLRPAPYMPAQLTRLALTPAQLYDFYSDARTELDVDLLAIPVESFVGQVGEPDAKALEMLFNKDITFKDGSKTPAKATPFDPASPEPGFRNPHLIKVKWVTGDPSAPFFKTVAATKNDLAAYPIFSWTPQMPLVDALRIAAGRAVFDSRLDQEYQVENRALMGAMYMNPPICTGPLGGDLIPSLASYFSSTDPAAIAGLFGALARPDGVFAAAPLFTEDGAVKHQPAIREAVRLELKQRAPLYASLIGSGASGPLTPLGVVSIHRSPVQLTPLPIVRETVTNLLERQQASKWVTANILFLKKLMEDEKVTGDELQMKRLLDRFGPNYAKASEGRERNRNLGLEVGETKKAFDKYEADTDPELKPLRDSFDQYYAQINTMEGRDGIVGKQPWKKSDFWRIFFDGTETAGLGSEARKFAARPWPPTVTLGNPTQLEIMMQGGGLQNMDSGAQEEFNALKMGREANRTSTLEMLAYAEKPFLVWKTEEQIGDPPRSLNDVKDRVAKAWKMLEARDRKALPYAQKIAEGLLRGNAQYGTALSFAGKDVGAKLIELTRIAKLAPTAPPNPFGGGGGGQYAPYQLQGQLKYPRDDTVQNLIALNGLKEPIKIGVPDIDNVNAALFQEAQKANRGSSMYVQILTNQPRDTFYVAVIDGRPIPVGWDGLARMLRDGAVNRDSLLDRAQAKRGEEFLQTFVQQLRDRFKVKVFDTAKGIDNDVGA
jgi:hypothetical protein